MSGVLWCILVAYASHMVAANKPVFDLSNNMRLVLLPADTKMGTIIYKLRASDADEDYPIQFRVTGKDSKMLAIENVDCSLAICQADVVLMRPLDPVVDKYMLSLEAIDTRGEKTVVQTEIQPKQSQGAFVGAPSIVRLSETTPENTLIESFIIKENPKLFRGIVCQLLPKAAHEFFTLSHGLPMKDKGRTRCDLRLKKKLDYESRSSFVLQILAENAWTNHRIDTRNVVVHDMIIDVADTQDTAPYFLKAPPVTKLPDSAAVGDEVLTVEAFDGDYANPRRIRYGLNPDGLPYSSYFQIDPDSGVVTVRKNLQDIESRPNSPVILRVIAEELDDGDGRSSRRSSRRETVTEVEVAIIIDHVLNRSPRFLQKHYITSLPENAIEGTQLIFEGGLDLVEDLDKGDNGKLELSIDGYSDTFEISPSIIEFSGQFVISVKNNKRLNFENTDAIEFTVVARELGLNKLTASAIVTVNLIDENDNAPTFDRDKYEIQVHENVKPGTVIVKVDAVDPDSRDNGKIRYTRLTGDDPIVGGLRLDPVSGEVTVVAADLLDRETADKHVFGVEAVDHDGQVLQAARTGQTTVEVDVLDVNDEKPKFMSPLYQGFMSSDLTHLRNELIIQATDGDAQGDRNSRIRYEILSGNNERKFSIDAESGKITVREALNIGLTRAAASNERRQNRQSRNNGGETGGALRTVDPVITLLVRAYDLGIPSLGSTVPVHIFTEEVSSRLMRFIIPEKPEIVENARAEFSDLISTMTGGEAVIEDIRPFDKESDLTTAPGSVKQLPYGNEQDGNREGKNVKEQEKTVVDVFVRYPSRSVIDVDAVTAKLVTNPNGILLNNRTGINNSTRDGEKIKELGQANAGLFAGLMVLVALIIIAILVIFCCFFCPGCYCFKDDNKYNNIYGGSANDLRANSARRKDLTNANFLEIIKEAKNRITSATSLDRTTGSSRWRSRVTSQESLYDSTERNRTYREYQRPNNIVDNQSGAPVAQQPQTQQQQQQQQQLQTVQEAPEVGSNSPQNNQGQENGADNIIIVREANGLLRGSMKKQDNINQTQSNNNNNNAGPIVIKTIDELDPNALQQQQQYQGQYRRQGVPQGAADRYIQQFGRSAAPNDRNKIFKVIDPEFRVPSRQGGEDIQILRLDDDAGLEETYTKLGNSELLNLDGEYYYRKNGAKQGPASLQQQQLMQQQQQQQAREERIWATSDPRLTYSEMDLARASGAIADWPPDHDPGGGGIRMYPSQPQSLQQPYYGPYPPPPPPQQPQHPAGHPNPNEYYTAIGPDGKEVILRRYLNDQAPEPNPYADRGFLSMAMNHLSQQPQHQQQQQPQWNTGRRNIGADGYDSGESFDDDYYHQYHQYQQQQQHPNYEGSDSEQYRSYWRQRGLHEMRRGGENPHIKTPIMEETESGIEAAERMSRKDRYKISYDNSDASVLRFKINNDGRDSPDNNQGYPAYVETKASILRRRNTMAKLLNEDDKKYSEAAADVKGQAALSRKNRNLSLNDLSKKSGLSREAKVKSFLDGFYGNGSPKKGIREWRSLSNDDLDSRQPRKFSKHNPNRGQQLMDPYYPGRPGYDPRYYYGPPAPHPPEQKSRFPLWTKLTDQIKSMVGKKTSEVQTEPPPQPQYFYHPQTGAVLTSVEEQHNIAQQQDRIELQQQQQQQQQYPGLYHHNNETSDSSSEVISRSSSVMSLPAKTALDKMVEEGENSRNIVDQSLARNIGVTPDLSSHGRPSTQKSTNIRVQSATPAPLNKSSPHSGRETDSDDDDVQMSRQRRFSKLRTRSSDGVTTAAGKTGGGSPSPLRRRNSVEYSFDGAGEIICKINPYDDIPALRRANELGEYVNHVETNNNNNNNKRTFSSAPRSQGSSVRSPRKSTTRLRRSTLGASAVSKESTTSYVSPKYMDWYDEHRKSTLTRRITSAEAEEAIALGQIIAREQDEDDEYLRSSAKASPSPRRRFSSRKPTTSKKSAAPKKPPSPPPEKERIQQPMMINESEENESGISSLGVTASSANAGNNSNSTTINDDDEEEEAEVVAVKPVCEDLPTKALTTPDET